MRMMFLAVVVIVFTGCGMMPRVKDHAVRHLLEATVPASGRSGAKPAVAVARPTLPPYLERSEMVTRSAGGTVEIHENDLWSEPLDRGIGRVVAENLRRLKGSANIQPSDNFISRDYDALLEIRIERFDPLPDGSLVLECTWKVQPVGGEVTPRNFRTIVPIVENEGDAFGGEMSGRVVAMNEALKRLALEVGRTL